MHALGSALLGLPCLVCLAWSALVCLPLIEIKDAIYLLLSDEKNDCSCLLFFNCIFTES